MSQKRNLQRKKLPPKQHQTRVNPSTGLRLDEIAFAVDPNNPTQAASYLMPNGKVLKPGDQGAPKGIPSIIHPELIITSSKKEGFRSTIASRLGEMLLIAENLFGKRDRSYSFLGIEFSESDPHLHFEANKSLINLSFG